jgi:hypothetical protein
MSLSNEEVERIMAEFRALRRRRAWREVGVWLGMAGVGCGLIFGWVGLWIWMGW